MKVVFVAYQDFASVAYYMAEALREQDIEAVSVSEYPQRFNLPNGLVVKQGLKRETYLDLIKDADVIVSSSGYFDYRPFGIPFPSTAKLALWNGGTNYRGNYDFYNTKVLPRYDVCYAHWDLAPLSPLNHVLNQPIDCRKYKYLRRRPWDVTRIGHIPSSPGKGTHIFEEAMHDLEKLFPNQFNWETVGDIGHDMVMTKKRQYHIYFDQILDQFIPPPAHRPYGLALVEAGVYGSVCMAGADVDEDSPIMKVMTKEDIIDVCAPILDRDYEFWRMVSEDTREFIEENHSYQACAKQFLGPLGG